MNMFGLKNKGREKARRFHDTLKAQISPHIARLGERFRLSARIRLANRWSQKHPKRVMTYYLTFSFCLLAFSIILDFFPHGIKETETLGLESIPSMSHRLQSLSNTEIQNERIKHEVAQFGQMGMLLYNELDSLLKLPSKTHEDSVRIATNYKILNDTFNKKQRHEHQKD